jgi:chromosome segregation ATPase
MQHRDNACKRQENKVLMKTVKYLQTKNGDYAKQVSQFSSMVDKLVVSNNENIQRISVLEEVVADKKSTIVKMSQDLESRKIDYARVVDLNGELQARVKEVSAANDELGEVNNANEEKNAELLGFVESLTKSLNDERSTNEEKIEEMMNMADTEKENNAIVVRKLEVTHKDITARMTAQMSELEDDVVVKKSMIDELSMDVNQLSLTCEENVAEIIELNKQLHLSNTESDKLKVTVQGLESKNTHYATELEYLMSSLQEVVDLNVALQAHINQVNATSGEIEEKNAELLDVVESLTKSLNDERSMNEEKIEEMMNMADTEKENNAIVVRKLEVTHKDITARMTAQMSVLEDDVVVKKSLIDELSMDVNQLSSTCEDKVSEITELNKQLQLSNTESDMLKMTVQGLESKNTHYATELENLMSSFQEVVDLNGELRARVKEVSADNDELREVNNANEKKNAELLDIVESLTKSLNDERSMHEREIDETKNIMEMEKANNAVTIQKLKAEMSTQKESSDANISNLVKSLDEAMVYRRDVSCKNEQIQKMMEEMKKSTTQATEDLVGAICQLEKDIDDEFQVTTQLKNGTEKLIMKLGDNKNSHYVDEVEDLLGNVRMIQCYQLSHFQMMNELATKYRGQIRSIQLLHTTII